MKLIDLSGKRFGRWLVIDRHYYDGRDTKWNCICDCGTQRPVRSLKLTRGLSLSCGCWQREMLSKREFIDIAGKRYGLLTVIKEVENTRPVTKWLCRCDCGRESIVEGDNLRYGTTKSCGCRIGRRPKPGEEMKVWERGRMKDVHGYISIYCPEYSNSPTGYVKEHTLVMSKHLGRPILRSETIHHKNGIRDDNRLENLELWSGKHPPGSRVSDLIAFAKEILLEYDPDSLCTECK